MVPTSVPPVAFEVQTPKKQKWVGVSRRTSDFNVGWPQPAHMQLILQPLNTSIIFEGETAILDGLEAVSRPRPPPGSWSPTMIWR